MIMIGKTKSLVTSLLAAVLAFGMVGSVQADVKSEVRVTGSITDATVGAIVTVFNATSGCQTSAQCQFSFATTPADLVGSGSKSTGDYTFTVPAIGTYTVEITGRGTNTNYISTWTIVAPAAAPGTAPSTAPAAASAKKYSISVTGYTYKKKGMSTIDNNRAAAVSSYLRSLGLDDTNSDYVVAGVELSKNTKKARSAVVSVTYMKDGKSVTVKKTIYFTAKKFSLTKKSKTTLKKLSTSVM